MINPDDPAFSTTCESQFDHIDTIYKGNMCCGLTKREYFAAQAEVPEFMVKTLAENVSNGIDGAVKLAKFIAVMKMFIANELISELNK